MARFPEIPSLCFWGPQPPPPAISWLCFELEQIRDHFFQLPWGYLIVKIGLGFALTPNINIGHHPGQVLSKKGARNELKMVPAVPRGKIAHAR